MIYVGIATPQIRWDMCLVAGRKEWRMGGWVLAQRPSVRGTIHGGKKKKVRPTLFLPSLPCFHPSATPRSLTVPLNLSAVALRD